MLVMTPLPNPELILSGAGDYIADVVSAGESTILINGVREFDSGVDIRKWARTHVGRSRGDYTLYIRYPSHVEEHRVVGGKAVESVHPTWDFRERGIDTLVPLLRGEWAGHMGHDVHGNTFRVDPVPGQEGYKLFMASMPMGRDISHRSLSAFLANARARGLVVPKIYYDSVKALAAGLNFGSDGVVYNPYYPARHGEAISCQGRRLVLSQPEKVRESTRAIEAVGFTVEELLERDVGVVTRFNIASARWAATHWHKDVMPLGPKAQAGGAKRATV